MSWAHQSPTGEPHRIAAFDRPRTQPKAGNKPHPAPKSLLASIPHDRRQETGDRRQETGDRETPDSRLPGTKRDFQRPEADSLGAKRDSCLLTPASCLLSPKATTRYASPDLIFVFGTICLDRLRRVKSLPAPGGYSEVQDEALMLGGEAANTANALNKWGAEVSLIGNDLGCGPDADLLRQLITDKGLGKTLFEPSRRDQAKPIPTPVCDIYVTPDGERTMFGRGFSTMELDLAVEDLPLQAGHWFTAEPNMDVLARKTAQRAIDLGMKTYLMDYLREDDPIAPGSFWQSSTDWCGFRNNMQKNVQWVKDLVSRHGCFAVLSDGPNGFVAGSPTMSARAFPPYPAPLVVDTTGAGDMFRAGMLFGLNQGWEIPQCLQYAAAAGCLKCRSLGATTQVPPREEVLAYVAEHDQVSRQYL